MKKRLFLLTVLIFMFGITTVFASEGLVTEVLKNRHGQTWVVQGRWGELDGKRAFFPHPPNGQVWIDNTHTEEVTKIVQTTTTVTVQDTIHTPTVTLRQKQVGSHEILMDINNPNYFRVKVNVELTCLSPDDEVKAQFEKQEQKEVILNPGINTLTFDSAKRHEGFTSYKVVLRVIENLHPRVHPDYRYPAGVGKKYDSIPLYIEFLPAEVSLVSNNAATEAAFGTNWSFRNPNTIDMDYKLEIIDARGQKVIETGRIPAGQGKNGTELGIPSKNATNTQTFKVTLDYQKPAPSPKVSQAQFTFIIAPASITLSTNKTDAPMETKAEPQSTGCQYGPSTYNIYYQWMGANWMVTSTVTNQSNIPITVTATVDGKSATYNLPPYGSTAGPSSSGTDHDAKTIQATTQWHTHSYSTSTTITPTGWKEIGRDSFTCNPPPKQN